jgi:hypothetical protein
MKDDPVPDADHIARYCSFTTLREDGTATKNAFCLRRRGETLETYLSVNWLELLCNGSREAQIEALRAAFAGKDRFKVGATARFAVHQVGELRAHVREQSADSRQLTVLHEPERDDPSHSAVYGLQPDEELVIAALIAEIVQETYPAKA